MKYQVLFSLKNNEKVFMNVACCIPVTPSYLEHCHYTFFRLPDDVLFVDEPQIARWDYDNNNWRLDGFSDFVYDEGN